MQLLLRPQTREAQPELPPAARVRTRPLMQRAQEQRMQEQRMQVQRMLARYVAPTTKARRMLRRRRPVAQALRSQQPVRRLAA